MEIWCTYHSAEIKEICSHNLLTKIMWNQPIENELNHTIKVRVKFFFFTHSERTHSVEKTRKSLPPKFFHEINSSVKTLVSRNFCQESVRVNLRNLNTTLQWTKYLQITLVILEKNWNASRPFWQSCKCNG